MFEHMPCGGGKKSVLCMLIIIYVVSRVTVFAEWLFIDNRKSEHDCTRGIRCNDFFCLCYRLEAQFLYAISGDTL